MTKKLLFILNEPTYFVSHRLPIALAAQKEGYEIHVATGVDIAPQRVHDEGFIYHSIPLSRSGRRVFTELLSIVAIYRLMKRIQPTLVHLVTIKPVIYGSLAARIAHVPAVVAAVSGLGHAFINHYLEARLLRQLISQLYRQAFRHKNLKIIFQNMDDKNTLINIGAVKENQTTLIHGSGVDLTHYQYHPELHVAPLVVVMASRLLRDKGIFEYVEAAKYLRKKGVHARFLLAGQLDPENPSAIDEKQLATWKKDQTIEYIGYCDDTPRLLTQVHLVVLPSYREGLPRVLAEAAACGRAVITTDVPGCRAAIIPNQTGLLVKVKDTLSLAEAIHKLLLDNDLRQAMGNAGRQFAENEFNITKIVAEHMQVYHNIVPHQQAKIPQKTVSASAPSSGLFLKRQTRYAQTSDVLKNKPLDEAAVEAPKTNEKPLQHRRIARVSTIPFSMLTQLRPQLAAIKKAGGQLTLIASPDTLSDELKQLDYGVFTPTYIAREIKFFADIVTLFKLSMLFRSQRFDVVHSITPKAGFLCAIASRLAGVPIRLHTYTGQPWVTMHGIKKSIVKYCDQLISILNTQCYTDSLSQQQFLINHQIIKPEKIKVLGSGSLAGIDLTRFNPDNFSTTDKKDFRAKLGLQESTFVFLFVGRVTEDKGIYELLQSTHDLLAKGYDIALLIVGPFEQQLEREIPPLAHKLCGNQVICTDFSREPERYMAIANVLCIPSYREGFGTVVIEAAAMGLPTIGTNIYGLTDAVLDGETGLLIEPKNIAQLTTAMKTLIDNTPLRMQLGENAKQRAMNEFDSDVCSERLIMEYHHLLVNSNKRRIKK